MYFCGNPQNYCVMKIKLLISLALASTVCVGAMTSENDSCPVNQDSVQLSADSTQLFDPLQGYIFERDTTKGWIVNSCPSIVIYSFVDSCGDLESIIKRRRSKYTTLKSPWEKAPRGVNGYFKLNGNKQTSNPENSTPWWIQE